MSINQPPSQVHDITTPAVASYSYHAMSEYLAAHSSVTQRQMHFFFGDTLPPLEESLLNLVTSQIFKVLYVQVVGCLITTYKNSNNISHT